MRLFVGIPLADRVRRELDLLCVRLRSEGDGLRWSTPESWHITLQFLGNASAGELDCLTRRLGEVGSTPVPVRLGELGIFERAGVFLVEVVLTPELQALQHRVTAASAQCGFVAEERRYQPHITLARAKGDGRRQLLRLKEQAARSAGRPATRDIETDADAAGQPRLTSFTATEFLLYESHLGPGGSRYEVKARFALHGPA